MKILIIDTYYPGFLASFWGKHKTLKSKPYHSQLKSLLQECFGTSDYYSYNLVSLGHEAIDIIANDEISQSTWAKEHGIALPSSSFMDKLRKLPYAYKLLGRSAWVDQIVLAQVKDLGPDIVYIQDLSILSPSTLRQIKSLGPLVVGQIASPLPPMANLRQFDLILTSFPHYVTKFTDLGIASEYFKIGFESRLLKQVASRPRKYDLSFIGSFSPYHSQGTKVLEAVARVIPVHVWGQGIEFLSPTSPLRQNYHGEAWGKEMYKILASSKMVINRHISSADNYANNMRLYESTGMGAMLLTDAKSNLNQLFKVGHEVVEYHGSQDLLSSIQYYLAHPLERERIALAGQRRTLKDHTYLIRMKELTKILESYL